MSEPMASSSSPTPSTVSRVTTLHHKDYTTVSIRGGSTSESEEGSIVTGKGDLFDIRSMFGADTIYEDSDEDDELLANSGNLDEYQGNQIGLFDVVKREFRVKTAVITNKAAYETPLPGIKRKDKVNFIQNMKNKVAVAMEYKNIGVEQLQNKDYKSAIKSFHLALLQTKALDPDEGVIWSEEFQNMEKDRIPIRMMPSELKEIKETVEIDCYLSLAACLHHKERVPYRRIKEYCLRVLDIRDDHIPAMVKVGMSCFYLREYELSRFYLQTAKDFSPPESLDPQVKKYLLMVEKLLGKANKKKK